MITKFENYKLITENPDSIECDSYDLYYEDEDAIPFYVKVNSDHTKVEILYVGKNSTTHGEIGYKPNRKYPGRLWLNSKIMSFWVYPNETLFKDIIKNIENDLNIKIFNNNWKIEVRTNNGEINKKEFNPTISDYYYNDRGQGRDNVIPIEDYIGSLDQPEEKRLWHLMNAEEKRIAKLQGKAPDFKGWGSDMTAWDGPNPLSWRQAKYQENKTNETPDYFTYIDKNGKKKEYVWYHIQARPFIFDVNKDHTKIIDVHLGRNHTTHGDIKDKKTGYDYSRGGNDDEKHYPGRLWRRRKVLSFWVYPNEKLFISMVKALEDALKIKIFNNGWKIEVITDENNGIIRKDDKDEKFYNKDIYRQRNLIPVEDYAGSANPSKKERLWHLMNAEEKRIAKLQGKSPDFKGWGSDRTAWDSKRPLPYRQAIYQENKNINDN